MAQKALRPVSLYLAPTLLTLLSGCVSVPELPNPFANKPKAESTAESTPNPVVEKAEIKQTQPILPAEIQALVDKANAGDISSMNELGDIYREGRNIAKDDKKAFEWYKKSADVNNPYGIVWTAYNLEKGIGAPQNLSESTRLYEKCASIESENKLYCQENYGLALYEARGITQNIALAIDVLQAPAQSGKVRSQTTLANSYNSINDQTNATKWFLVAAQQGDLESQRYVGNRIRLGSGIKKDVKLGLEWITKAANSGLIEAQTNLGHLYRNGEGKDIPKNLALALYWYMEAAKQGDKNAQLTVGYMYGTGEGVTRNYFEAVNWYRKAADQGDATAQYNLGYYYDSGRGVAQNYQEAIKWYQKAADQAYASAMLNLGYIYANGNGVTKDYKKAYELYTKAAETGEMTAINNVGSMFENGQHVQQSYTEAARWYLRAAEAGNGRSMRNIAVMFEQGNGVPFSPSQALEWYQKGANAGDELAMERLGKAYEFGQLGLKKDIKQSNTWYKKAEQARNR